MTLDEIKKEGFRVLVEHLGISGALLFLMQFDKGKGNYTKERRKLLKDYTLDKAIREIKKYERY